MGGMTVFSVMPVLRERRMWRMLSRRSIPCVHRTSMRVRSVVMGRHAMVKLQECERATSCTKRSR